MDIPKSPAAQRSEIAESAAPPGFHPQVLPENEAVSRINLYGGPLKGDLEALYGFLQKSIGPQQMSRGYYFRYPRMDALFEEHWDDLRSRMGRGIPRERFRPLLAQCLSFLREQQVIEVLPVLQAGEQAVRLNCADYVLLQQATGTELETQPFLDRAIADSAEAAARFVARNDPSVVDLLSRRLANREADFIEAFPFFRLRAAYRGVWHPPVDETHGYFGEILRLKEQHCLVPVYTRLATEGKLFFESRLEGIRKLGAKFPLAWPTADPHLAALNGLHTKMREIFVGHILGLGSGADGKGPAELHYKANTAPAFQAICQTVASTPALPTAAITHNLGVQTLQFARAILLKPDDKLRADLRFARNLMVAIVMHTETVSRFEHSQVARREEDLLKECVQAIARAAPPLVDLNALVRTKEPTESNRPTLFAQIQKHDQIRTVDQIRKVTFGSERTLLAFHLLRINDVFGYAARAAREGDFSYHMTLERRFGTQQHPEKLEPQLRADTYVAYLQTREAFYVANLPWYRRLLYAVGIGTKVDPTEVGRVVHEGTSAMDATIQAIETKEQRVEIKKKREEMARSQPAAADVVEDPVPEDLPAAPGRAQAAVPPQTSAVSKAPGPRTADPLRPAERGQEQTAGAQPASRDPARANSQPASSERPPGGAPPAARATPAAGRPADRAGDTDAKVAPGTPQAPAAEKTRPAAAAPSSADLLARAEEPVSRPAAEARMSSAGGRAANPSSTGGSGASGTPPASAGAKQAGPRPPDGERTTGTGKDETPDEPLEDEDLGSLLGVEVTQDLSKPRMSREELTRMTHELEAKPVSREIDDRAWEQALGKEAREDTRRQVPTETKVAKKPGGKGWEAELIRAGGKIGVDLTEAARLERAKAAAARRAEKERKQQERRKRAEEKARQRKKTQAQRHAHAAASGGGAGAGTSRKHSVIVSVPVDFSTSGQPDEILFKKQFFKDAEFRAGMARFYEAEAGRATSSSEKKYYEFLRSAMEENYAQFL